MDLLLFIFVTVILIVSDGFIVKGPSGPLIVPLGSSAVLPCYVETPLVTEKLRVEWRRTDSEALVHLYQDGESRPEAQQQDYHDRAHFFTDQIQHGNFSIRLDNLRGEDKGIYRCAVYSEQNSGETVVQIKYGNVESLLVSGSDDSISASVGGDVTLNCFVNSHITSEQIEEVSWKKTDEDEDILVLLYQNKETLPDSSDERYRDRVEFFTDEIPKGNFSLRLKSVRTEDKGVYMCQVFVGGLSASATAVLEQLGFSVSQIMVLIFCITASGSVLLLCSLIYCRSSKKGFSMQHMYHQFFDLGESVVFPCHIDKHLLKKGLKVEWSKKHSETLVHLYQDGESRPEAQHQDYHDRAHFFTDQIQHGNFSLHLENLRAEDKGKYTCKVYNQTNCVYLVEASLNICLYVRVALKLDFVPVGGSAVLPCWVDKQLLQKNLKVEWRRTDSGTLVHLYQDGESRPEAQQQDYHNRAHFFTDEIQHGNFSLRLDNLSAKDKGIYRCTVYSEQDCVFSAEAEVALGFAVKYFYRTLAPLGSSVVLPYYADKPLPTEDLKVEWRRTDSETIVHLYQDGESRPEAQQQDYYDRAHFFTDQIQHGNFSIRLDNLRSEDEGQYTCKVFRNVIELFTARTNLELRQQGFFMEHAYLHFYHLGDSVVMPCHVDKHLLNKNLKVEWRRKDTKILVHLYQDGESRPEEQHKDYYDRAYFFTDQIKYGNFSIRLDMLRAEYEGEYTCEVHSNQDCVYSAQTKLELCFCVKQSTGPLGFLSLGGSAVLPCQVDKCLLQNNLKVEWRRTDSESLVLLYQNCESRPEEQQQVYHDRAHFFTDQIQDGNFSLCLDNLRAEDKGIYRCKVYCDQNCVFSAETELVQEFLVENIYHTLAPLGSSVVLPYYVNKPLLEEDLKVEWRRPDSETMVHLYQDGEIQAEKQQQDYHDRAHFFTEEIQHGNFSIRLDNLTAEDAGEYTCRVYKNKKKVCYARTHLELKEQDTVFRLQMFLVFFPNFIMFLAFVFWGVTEGSLHETVSCCALYILRPLMLLCAGPYVQDFTRNIKAWIKVYSYTTQYGVFSTVLFSALFKSAWDKSINYARFDGVLLVVLIVMVLLLILLDIIVSLTKIMWNLSQWVATISGLKVLSYISFNILPSLQFILLIYIFGSAREGLFFVAVLPILLSVTQYKWDFTCRKRMGCSPLVRRSAWLTVLLLVNAVMVYFYIIELANKKDRIGWACTIVYVQALWAVVHFTLIFKWDIHRVVPMYLFGSAGIVLLNAVILMTELILKTVKGHGAVGDLRITVFSSEFIFTLFLLVFTVFEPWTKLCLRSCQNGTKSCQTPANGSQKQDSKNGARSDEAPVRESHELETLLKTEDHEASRCDVTEETQLDSVETQT